MVGVCSFHCFLIAFSSYWVGASKKNLLSSQKSLTKEARSLMSPTTFSTVAIGAVTPLSVRSFWKRVANSSLGFICKYWWLNHLIFSGSKRAPALCTFSKSNSWMSCSIEKISSSFPGFHPKSAKKLIRASGK